MITFILGTGTTLVIALMVLIFVVQVLVGILYHGSKFIIKNIGLLLLLVGIGILSVLGAFSSLVSLILSLFLLILPLLIAILVIKLLLKIIK